jgi:uncharacterized membrane protein (UPF0127 family)
MYMHKLHIHFKKIAKLLLYVVLLLTLITYVPPVYKKVQMYITENFTHKKIISVGPTTIKVEIADTQVERIQGLSHRQSLKDGHGMLFVFDKADRYGIWMKDMNFAIDIIWFNEYREVSYIIENAKPESYPENFLPPTPSIYVLEVPAGFVKNKNIRMGDLIDFY